MKQSLNNPSKGIIDQRGNEEWKNLMMDMKRLQEKKVALEEHRMQWDLDNHCTGLSDQSGDEEWEKLMIDMERVEEKKIAFEDQGLQKDLVQGMALQRQLEEEETLLGRRYREEKEKEKKRGFEGLEDRSHFGNWVDEQSLERLELRAEKKLKMEEAHELDRIWDSNRYQVLILKLVRY